MTQGSPHFDWGRSFRLLPSSTEDFTDSNKNISTQQLTQAPCALVLGQPGLGKSDVLSQLHRTHSGGESILIDLKGKSSWEEIRRRLVDDSVYGSWRTGTFLLTLHLDSLDECLLRAESLGPQLAGELTTLLSVAVLPRAIFTTYFQVTRLESGAAPHVTLNERQQRLAPVLERLGRYMKDTGDTTEVNLDTLPSEVRRQLPLECQFLLEHHRLGRRFQLRLACRTNDWAFSYQALERSLLHLWPQPGAVVKAELQPLGPADIQLAIEGHGVDREAFLLEIHRAGVASLVSRPRHLLRLLKLFQRDQLPLPGDDLTLNERAALDSCREWDEDRIAAPRRLNAAQRLEVAARLAAGVVLCGKRVIFAGPELGRPAEDQVPVSSLVGYREQVLGQSFAVNESEIRDTLTTELFRSAVNGESVFDHLTTAEYLSARYLRRFPAERALELLTHPDDSERRVLPALREVAVWLARLEPTVMDLLLDRDSGLFLRSDAEFTEPQRRRMVDALLHQTANHGIEGYDLGELNRPERLLHADLCLQLKPYVSTKNSPLNTRYGAFRLIEVLNVKGLSTDLFNVISDGTDNTYLRRRAVRLLLKIDDGMVQPLIKLLQDPQFVDPEDDIRGYFLEAVKPQDLPTRTLITLLKQPAAPGGHSFYHYILSLRTFWEHHATQDLPALLAWITQPSVLPWAVQVLGKDALDYLLTLGWAQIDEPRIESAVILIVRHLIHHELDINSFPLHQWLTQHVNTEAVRRRLLTNLIELERIDPHRDTRYQLPELSALRHFEDAGWIMACLEREPNESIQEIWIHLLTIRLNNVEHFETLLRLIESMPTVAARFRSTFVVDLDSDEAGSMKRWFLEEQKREERRAKLQKPVPPVPAQLVASRLARLVDHPEEWWLLAKDLTLKEGDTGYFGTLERDIQALPGWKEADEATRDLIVRTAAAYVAVERDYREEWLTTEQFDFRALAGYQALYLLAQHTPTVVTGLSAHDWDRWVGILLDCPNQGNDQTDQRLMSLAYSTAQPSCLQAIQQMVLSQARNHKQVSLPQTLGHIQDQALRDLLYRLLTKNRLLAEAQASLLHLLIAWHHPPAIALAKRWLKKAATDAEQKRAEEAATALLRHAGQHWTSLQAYLDSAAEDRTQRYLKLLAWRDNFGDCLDVASLKVLFLKLHDLFPPDQDPEHSSGIVYQVTPRDRIARVRDDLLTSLAQRGTLEAVRTLQELLLLFPSSVYIQVRLREGWEGFRRSQWLPLTPAELMHLASTPTSRLVRSSRELLDAIVESLERLDARLQGETPLAPLLWNEVWTTQSRADVVWTPRTEERLSDLVRWHLEADLKKAGLILNREVQIRPGEGGARGERTDIQVETKVPITSTQDHLIGVIIEVKGQWNRDMLTALPSQLSHRYLKDNLGRAGLYLVGYFRCAQWAKDDRREEHKKATRSIEHLKSLLDEQAVEHSRIDQPVKAFVLNATLR